MQRKYSLLQTELEALRGVAGELTIFHMDMVCCQCCFMSILLVILYNWMGF